MCAGPINVCAATIGGAPLSPSALLTAFHNRVFLGLLILPHSSADTKHITIPQESMQMPHIQLYFDDKNNHVWRCW